MGLGLVRVGLVLIRLGCCVRRNWLYLDVQDRIHCGVHR